MNAKTQEEIARIMLEGTKRFQGLKLPEADFTPYKDLRNVNFRGASLTYADFSGCDLSCATFEAANLYGSKFTGAKMHRVNLKDATLAETIMDPLDLYGVTITLECKSFQGMKLSAGNWFSFLFYGLVMQPPTQEAEDALITFLGPERYMVLRNQYARRQM